MFTSSLSYQPVVKLIFEFPIMIDLLRNLIHLSLRSNADFS
jgi:hypothetical protein